jgi:hypothetical protein
MPIACLFYSCSSSVLINNSTPLIIPQTVRALRADYRTMQVSRDELHVQLSDFKEQLEYKQLVAQTVDVALGALSTSSPSLRLASPLHFNACPALSYLLVRHVMSCLALPSTLPYYPLLPTCYTYFPSFLACCRHAHHSPHLLLCYH